MPFKFSDAQKNALQRFLERRNLKERTIELLGAALASNSLKRGDLTQNQSATYEKLIDDVETAIKKKWLTEDDLITLLDESELAGRQHICVFSIQAKSADAVLSEVLTPDYLTTDLPVLEDFWTVPTTPTARLLRATKTEAVVKIVTDRRYWLREIDLKRSTTEEEWIHRWTERERSAILVKFSKSTNRLQVRIPPKEKASQSESGKSVYEFVRDALSQHYDLDEKNSWFRQLGQFPIIDSYPEILKNRKDFVLRYDAPESDTAKSRLSKKGSLSELEDLRDDPMWTFEKSADYARKALRGAWIVGESPIYSHLNWDHVRLSDGGETDLARVFIPRLAKDAEVDHVIQRISEHF